MKTHHARHKHQPSVFFGVEYVDSLEERIMEFGFIEVQSHILFLESYHTKLYIIYTLNNKNTKINKSTTFWTKISIESLSLNRIRIIKSSNKLLTIFSMLLIFFVINLSISLSVLPNSSISDLYILRH